MAGAASPRMGRAFLLGMMLLGCRQELTGPAVSVASVGPRVFCAGKPTRFGVIGTGLAPILKDGLTSAPTEVSPTVTFQREADLEGNAVAPGPQSPPTGAEQMVTLNEPGL